MTQNNIVENGLKIIDNLINAIKDAEGAGDLDVQITVIELIDILARNDITIEAIYYGDTT